MTTVDWGLVARIKDGADGLDVRLGELLPSACCDEPTLQRRDPGAGYRSRWCRGCGEACHTSEKRWQKAMKTLQEEIKKETEDGP